MGQWIDKKWFGWRGVALLAGLGVGFYLLLQIMKSILS